MTDKELREKFEQAFLDAPDSDRGWVSDQWLGRLYARLLAAGVLATPAMLEAAEACKAWAALGVRDGGFYEHERRALNAGRALLAAEKPKGPWRVDGLNPHHAVNCRTNALLMFYERFDGSNAPNRDACAEFVTRENERLSKERRDG